MTIGYFFFGDGDFLSLSEGELFIDSDKSKLGV
jgi:hypothetical protein